MNPLETLRNQANINEEARCLSPESVEALRTTNVMRMLQPKTWGGFEAEPHLWAETIMEIAQADPAAGWVAGVVGVHPWETAFLPEPVQAEVWKNPDAWIASPYAPMGSLRRNDEGFTLDGTWAFSTGSDHCEWFVLGAYLANDDRTPQGPFTTAHVFVHRRDVEIVEDSWRTVGLRGTGSNDIVIRAANIPEAQVLFQASLDDGSYLRTRDLNPLYHLPLAIMFPLGITSALIGICEGGAQAFKEYQKNRRLVTGVKAKNDPYSMPLLGEAEAQLRSARRAFLSNARDAYELAVEGAKFTSSQRISFRTDQVSAAHAAVSALDKIVTVAGANGMREDHPLQRYWRDAHMGLAHAIHVPGPLYNAAALDSIGETPPPGMGYLI